MCSGCRPTRIASTLEGVSMTSDCPAESDLLEVGLQPRHFPGRDNGPHIAVRTHQQPIAHRWGVAVVKVASRIDQVAVGAEDMDMQARAGLHRSTLDLIAKQCPVPTSEQLEQSARLTGGTPDRGIRGTVAGDHTAGSIGLSQR